MERWKDIRHAVWPSVWAKITTSPGQKLINGFKERLWVRFHTVPSLSCSPNPELTVTSPHTALTHHCIQDLREFKRLS